MKEGGSREVGEGGKRKMPPSFLPVSSDLMLFVPKFTVETDNFLTPDSPISKWYYCDDNPIANASIS